MHWRQYQQMQKVIEIGDRFISYVDLGQGPPLVLLHGLPTWGYLWHKLLPALEHGRRVLIPDLPGFGYSDRSDRFDRSIARQAERLRTWMQALGLETADLVGHDIGGGVALRLAAFYPQRVSRLVLIDTVSYDSWPIEPMLQVGHPGTRRRLPAPAFLKLMRRALRPGFHEADDGVIEGLLSPYSTEEGKVSLIRDAAALDANHTMELVPLLPGVRTPTLVVWGAEDPFQPLHYGQRLTFDLPNARLAVIGQASHFVPLDKPEETAMQIESFLGHATA